MYLNGTHRGLKLCNLYANITQNLSGTLSKNDLITFIV